MRPEDLLDGQLAWDDTDYGRDLQWHGISRDLPPVSPVAGPVGCLAAWPLPTSVDGRGDGEVEDTGVETVEVRTEGSKAPQTPLMEALEGAINRPCVFRAAMRGLKS